jgi:two-component system chemotaxis response regulator CheB
MVVDDSAFFRRRIKEILKSDNHIEVVGTATNGAEAVEKVTQLDPDVITMDIEMPVMDGISAVRAIMKKHPTSILMFSSLTTYGAKATLDALDAGAVDFMPKRMEDISVDREEAKRQLCARIRLLGSRRSKIPAIRGDSIRIAKKTPEETESTLQTRTAGKGKRVRFSCSDYKLILIGASTGGPVALQQIMTSLPEGFPVPILIVQHMPASFTSAFAQRLNSISKIKIKQAEDGDFVSMGSAILAPGGRQMILDNKDGRVFVRVQEATEDQTYKPSVDVTFESAARNVTGKILAIMLTGMGADGRDGARLLKERNSTIWAQNEMTSVVYGMPMAVVDAGLADAVISLPDIGATLSRGV